MALSEDSRTMELTDRVYRATIPRMKWWRVASCFSAPTIHPWISKGSSRIVPLETMLITYVDGLL